MQRYGIPGVGIAIIKNNNIVHQNYYGLANIEHNVLVSDKTIFPLLSTTKIPVAVGVFKLIEDEKLGLEDNISKYLPDLPESWRKVKIKNLLSHSSGLPEILEYEEKDEVKTFNKAYQGPIKFPVGATFDYNQTNFCLLDKIIEKVTGKNFENYILEQFQEEDSQALFSNNMLEIINNRANRYTFFNDRNHFELDAQRNEPYFNSGNGLNMTLNDFVQWNYNFQNNDFISAKTKSNMLKKFNYTEDAPDFGYGWEIHKTNNVLYYAFSGGYTTEYRTYQKDGLTIIWLTNGFEKFYRTNPVIDYIAGIVDEDLEDLDAINAEKITKIFENNNVDKSIEKYYTLKETTNEMNVGNALNLIGYEYLRKKEIENSIKVFELNVKENPTIWNYYDSLAEGYLNNNDLEKSILFYNKASEMNSSQEYREQVVKLVNNLNKRLENN